MSVFFRRQHRLLIPFLVLGACTSKPNPVDTGKETGLKTETGTADSGKETGDDPETGDAPLVPRLVVKDGRFWDADGGEVILRGVNVAGSAKVPDFLPLNDVSELAPLPNWGMNVIRLLFIWEAYEPQPGVFNTDYLDNLTAIADTAGQLGLRVILDFHQDGYSRYLASGCGDGFPQWTIPPNLSQDTPDNGSDCALWPALVLGDPDVHSAFSDFYADTYGVRTAYLNLMSDLAAHFSSHSAVIGYDLFNEPWGWEVSEISPLYEDAARAIRQEHPEAILWIEGHASTNNGITQSLLAKPTFDNMVYAPHFYEATVLGSHLWTGLTQGVEHGFSTMTAKANEWGAPLFLGEFGTHGDTINAQAYVELHYDQLDHYLASGVQWNYTPKWNNQDKDGWNHEDLSIVNANGSLRKNFTPRPQPQRFAGTALGFQADEQEVLVRWNHDPAAGETVFFLPAQTLWKTTNPVLVPDGQNLTCTFSPNDQRVRCTSDQSGEMKLLAHP